ncbi:MAG: exodeoxyribonuclease VII large subunit [Clostridia bacterium]|jgi:exodeoxyribonuclease VII large subunit|nr:exodeoxyribonuclease VII large subunit [Clostridia bacterium]
MKEKIFSVYEINKYIKYILSKDILLSSVQMTGEVSNLKIHSSGHMYFSLKDKDSSINAVMFKNNVIKSNVKMENNKKIIVRGYVSSYEKTGQYQFYVESIKEDGIGNLSIEFEKLKKKLEEEGLFDSDRKRAIPSNIKKVGVVTSDTGAAIRDIINVIKRRNKLIDIYLVPALVQGDNAHKSIIKGIETLNNYGKVDVLIIGRGGGSIEDLWCFNNEELARVIYKSKIPIVSAVGHEIDFTISDFVSDKRAATPSEAAEFVSEDIEEKLYNMNKKMLHIESLVKSKLKLYKERIRYIKKSNIIKNPEKLFDGYKQNLDSLYESLNRLIDDKLNDSKLKLSNKLISLDNLSPLKVMRRGYSISKVNDNVIRNIEDVEKGQVINTLFSGFEIESKIVEIKTKEN